MATVYIRVCPTPYTGRPLSCTSETQVAVDDVVIQGTTLQIAARDTVDPQRVADMYELFLLFIGVFATVWGLKRIYAIFNGDMER